MMYFLDFDRTLFDTDTFREWLLKHPLCSGYKERVDGFPIGSPERQEVWKEIWEFVQKGEILLSDADIRRYVYPDVAHFFETHAPNIVIITFGPPGWQEFKVKRALPFSYRDAIFNDGIESKADSIIAWHKNQPVSGIFVDDHVFQLETAAQVCPELSLFEIRRDGGAGDGRWPMVRSLTELP
jgi:hypothetical protein